MKPKLKEIAALSFVLFLAIMSVASTDGAMSDAKANAIEPAEFTPGHDGREVTVTFEVAYTQHVGGDREGEFPTLLLHHIRKDKSDRAVIYVKKDLADVMHRLAIVKKDSLKGRTITASGTVVFREVLSKDGNRLPLYEFELREWKKFQIHSRQSRPKKSLDGI